MKKRFVPQRDITVYELAYIMSKLIGSPVHFDPKEFEALPDWIKRHFADEED